MVHDPAQLSRSDAAGYSGVEISVSSDGSRFVEVYSRYEMFGAFERGADYELEAPEFVYDAWTVHAFTSVQVTHVAFAVRSVAGKFSTAVLN